MGHNPLSNLRYFSISGGHTLVLGPKEVSIKGLTDFVWNSAARSRSTTKTLRLIADFAGKQAQAAQPQAALRRFVLPGGGSERAPRRPLVRRDAKVDAVIELQGLA